MRRGQHPVAGASKASSPSGGGRARRNVGNAAAASGDVEDANAIVERFMTVENLRQCEDRFREVMQNKHGIDLDTEDDSSMLRKLLYGVMRDVSEERGSGMSLRDLNNATMNAAREAVLLVVEQRATRQQMQMQMPQQQPQQHQLQQQQMMQYPQHQMQGAAGLTAMRDAEIYGDRRVTVADVLPQPSVRRADLAEGLNRSFDQAWAERGGPPSLGPAGPPGLPVAVAAASVSAMDTAEFERRLADLALARVSEVVPAASVAATEAAETAASMAAIATMPSAQARDETGLVDSQAIVRRGQEDMDTFREAQRLSGLSGMQLQQQLMPLELYHPQPSQENRTTSVRYLTLSGSDRDEEAYPYRFQFTARTGGNQTEHSLQGTYRDVQWIEATRVILPSEIVQATGTVVMPKGWYNMEFSFAYPYVVLCLGGLSGVCDGTNEALRNAFCVLAYDSDYRAPNGRGYVLLRPMQGERKTFRTPMASLGDLAVTILKPNGTLFNNSSDVYRVASLQYDPQNRLYLKVILDRYFDRNELFMGDSVRVRGMAMTASPAALADGIAPYVATLEAYVNRPEGFEIVQMAQPNDQGFYRAFYVLAPGVLDVANGRVITDANMIAVVNALGAGAGDPLATVAVTTPGRLLNMSLQPTVALRVGCAENVLRPF